MKKLIMIQCVILYNIIYSQNIKNGMYIGYEANPLCYAKTCARDYKENKIKKNEPSYKVILKVTDSTVSMTKLSVKYINRRKQIVDSTIGGYYNYGKIDISDDSIFARLDNCKYCKKGGHGVKKYNYLFFKISQTEDGILLSNEYIKNLELKKN